MTNRMVALLTIAIYYRQHSASGLCLSFAIQSGTGDFLSMKIATIVIGTLLALALGLPMPAKVGSSDLDAPIVELAPQPKQLTPNPA